MLEANKQKLKEVREMTSAVLESLLESQRLILVAIEECHADSYDASREPIKGISKKIDDIDNSIVTVFSRYAPEARDLREMVAFLKITSSLQRIVTNEKNYIKNMRICNPDTEQEIKATIQDSLAINRCTINALEYTIEMVSETEDHDRLKELESKISVEASKTDDIYSLAEKDILQMMKNNNLLKDENINLLKYVRKNLKIIERLEDIASWLIFARIGGTL